MYYKKSLDLIVTHPVIDPVIDSIAFAIKSHQLRELLSLHSAITSKETFRVKKKY